MPYFTLHVSNMHLYTSFQDIYSEDDILSCQIADKIWLCPIKSCEQALSRKQTLKIHLITVHNVQGIKYMLFLILSV